jgi:hypothetical protein
MVSAVVVDLRWKLTYPQWQSHEPFTINISMKLKIMDKNDIVPSSKKSFLNGHTLPLTDHDNS